jgi:transcriptional regulator with XRE-family HTH domain
LPETPGEFNLLYARLNRGHTARSLAAELGIDQRTLARLERGQAVSPAKAKVVADYFGVQVTDLMPADDQRFDAALGEGRR